MVLETLILRVDAAHAFAVLAPYEQKGFELVGMKTDGGSAIIAFRAEPVAITAGRALAAKLLKTLPAGTTLHATQTQAEALELLHSSFGAPASQVSKEVVQWEPDEDAAWVRDGGEEAPLGSHDDMCERFLLADLLTPNAVGSDIGKRFCHQMRRDSYVPIVVPAATHRMFTAVEDAAATWFLQDEEEKNTQGGAYGHVDRKFTGYRCGKFREQLEVRQTLDDTGDGLYPWPRAPSRFGDELKELIDFLDSTARGLLRHIAVDVGADDGFFEGLLDPPPSPAAAKAGAKKGGGKENGHAAANGTNGSSSDVPPTLGHSLIRLCKYDPEDEGVYGSNVLCEQHNDVGFITLDACASVAGLEVLRRADGMWVPLEEAPKPADGSLIVVAMVGDTLGRLTANYYAPCKHRVVQPPSGVERIGLPFLFRGRSDAVLNTQPTRDKCKREGRAAHLADMETTTIKELPAFDSARAILRGWFRGTKKDGDDGESAAAAPKKQPRPELAAPPEQAKAAPPLAAAPLPQDVASAFAAHEEEVD